jgi:hypothetical protein
MPHGKHQRDTMPANFSQIFEENFLKSFGEWNSGEEKFNEISSKFMGMKSPPSPD